ncbi:hypothetical protein [Pontibacter populi]|uniref:Uncharacterized protein n=1 Tax=Pontibacter populi TaxID=890055 RepID=A0ABV1RXP4_9BACT
MMTNIAQASAWDIQTRSKEKNKAKEVQKLACRIFRKDSFMRRVA